MRVLLSIGCDSYADAGALSGAEADATRMFNALMRPEVGEYSTGRSRLLLSPTLTEVREALSSCLFGSAEPIDTFTFFFAGHGQVGAASFYMWLRDSRHTALSLTGLPLADLFRAINEAKPAQSNIIVDACESGGLIADLGVLLKSELIGDSGTPGITLVATSARNQGAGETADGGFGTNAVLDCIEGREFVNDTAAALDLADIGRQVTQRLHSEGQNPVVWGLNLYGPARFCKNPRFGTDPSRPLREVLQAWPSTSDNAARLQYDALWKAYSSASGKWEARSFLDTIQAALASVASSPVALVIVAGRFSTALWERCSGSADVFRRSQVSAAMFVSLLPYLDQEGVADHARGQAERLGSDLLLAVETLVDDLRADRFALLAKRGGGLADLYYLPIRIAKALGWASLAGHCFPREDSRGVRAASAFTELLRLLLTNYGRSIACVSDAQAPHWAACLSMAAQYGLRDEAEELAGLLFHSFISSGGKIARIDTDPEGALSYLMALKDDDFEQRRDLLERPTSTLTVLLKTAQLLGLEEVFDPSLWKIDGSPFIAYLPDDFVNFGCKTMSGGRNLVWSVGHDIFRVEDLGKSWPPEERRPEHGLQALGAICASLLFPDRLPWFCFAGQERA